MRSPPAVTNGFNGAKEKATDPHKPGLRHMRKPPVVTAVTGGIWGSGERLQTAGRYKRSLTAQKTKPPAVTRRSQRHYSDLLGTNQTDHGQHFVSVRPLRAGVIGASEGSGPLQTAANGRLLFCPSVSDQKNG